MPNYPEPGNLANANGVTFAGVAALPGGVVYGRDGQVIREMLAAVSTIRFGDAVILAPSLASVSPYFVTTTSAASTDTTAQLRYGIVVGGRVSGNAASAASVPVWVAIEGPAWAIAEAATSLGDFVAISSLPATNGGDVARSVNGRVPRTYGATVSFAGSLTSTGGGVYYIDVTAAPAGLTSNDIPIAFVPDASLAAELVVGNVYQAGSISFGVRMFGVNVSNTIASQASIPGTLFTMRTSQPLPGAVLGTVLVVASAASRPTLIHVDKW